MLALKTLSLQADDAPLVQSSDLGDAGPEVAFWHTTLSGTKDRLRVGACHLAGSRKRWTPQRQTDGHDGNLALSYQRGGAAAPVASMCAYAGQFWRRETRPS